LGTGIILIALFEDNKLRRVHLTAPPYFLYSENFMNHFVKEDRTNVITRYKILVQ